MAHLYHGSAIAGITALEPHSILHGSDKRVVYLTDNLPCALFYIWDGERIGYHGKHVTGGIRNGTAFYEEQFPNQLEAFYQGASGYLYRVPRSPVILSVEGREGLYCTLDKAVPAGAEYVPDVYRALLDCEARGELEVRRYTRQTPARREELVELMAQSIAMEGFCRDDPARAAFLQKYFAAAWERALGRDNAV